jgi:hypothetical protein
MNTQPPATPHGTLVSIGDEFNLNPTYSCHKCRSIHGSASICDGLRGGYTPQNNQVPPARNPSPPTPPGHPATLRNRAQNGRLLQIDPQERLEREERLLAQFTAAVIVGRLSSPNNTTNENLNVKTAVKLAREALTAFDAELRGVQP